MRGVALLAAALAMSACAPPPAANGPLETTVWRPDGAPAAVIVALHGFGDHGASTFGRAADYWAGRGIFTYAPDQRGFGRNADRGRWPGAERLVADAAAAVADMRAAHPETPVYLLGHSMGGGAALAAAERAGPDGLILAAPAVWGGPDMPARYRLAAWAGTTLLPEKRWTGDGVVRIQASDNIEMLRRLGRDPLAITSPSSRELQGLIRLADKARAAAAHTLTPTLLLYGERDEVAPRAAVEAAHAALAGPKRLVLYPDGWHMLFRDLQAEVVWRDVADWIEERP